MAKAMIWWDKDVSAYRLKLEHSGNILTKVVDFLKQNIPYDYRQWDPDTKIWTFTETYYDGVNKFCNVMFGSIRSRHSNTSTG